MIARVIRVEGSPNGSPDEAARNVNENVIPRLRGQRGFVSGHWLRSPDGAKGITVVIWQDAESDAANEAEMGENRKQTLERAGMHIVGMDTYEVMAQS